jgi:acetyltransferase-like isoleucine patch superfamily enzyme
MTHTLQHAITLQNRNELHAIVGGAGNNLGAMFDAGEGIVEDDVTIYAGATILGRVTIGRGSIIGGNVWLTRDVAAGSRVLQTPARAERYSQGAGI